MTLTIALLVAQRVATVLKISGKDFKSHPASERHNAFLITAAYGMCVHGLIRFHTQVDLSRPRSKKATTTRHIFTKEVACDVKLKLSSRASGLIFSRSSARLLMARQKTCCIWMGMLGRSCAARL